MNEVPRNVPSPSFVADVVRMEALRRGTRGNALSMRTSRGQGRGRGRGKGGGGGTGEGGARRKGRGPHPHPHPNPSPHPHPHPNPSPNPTLTLALALALTRTGHILGEVLGGHGARLLEEAHQRPSVRLR